MKTLKEERNKTEVGLQKKAIVLASIIAVIALVVGSFFGDRGILHLMTERQHADKLSLELQALRTENQALSGEIRALKTDPRSIERLAREELGWAPPEETVFLIREDAKIEAP